jgi:hypothetical protein
LFVQTKEFASIILQFLGRILFEGGGREEEETEEGRSLFVDSAILVFPTFCLHSVNLVDFIFWGGWISKDE